MLVSLFYLYISSLSLRASSADIGAATSSTTKIEYTDKTKKPASAVTSITYSYTIPTSLNYTGDLNIPGISNNGLYDISSRQVGSVSGVSSYYTDGSLDIYIDPIKPTVTGFSAVASSSA